MGPKHLGGGTSFDIGNGQTVYARNLTPDAATGLTLTEAPFIDAIRTGADYHGVGDGGTPTASLIVMPWAWFRWMSTYDLKSVYAYLRAIPAVSNAVTADTKPSFPPTAFPATYDEGATPRALPPETDAQKNPIADPDNVLRGTAINALAVLPPSDAAGATLFGRGSYIVNRRPAAATATRTRRATT